MLNFWTALVLLGIGWNFMFVGGTTLLAECYTAAEAPRVQGMNDFLVFGVVALSSLSSGTVARPHWLERCGTDCRAVGGHCHVRCDLAEFFASPASTRVILPQPAAMPGHRLRCGKGFGI